MNASRTRVAVVDADPGFSRALGRMLRASGFEVLLYPSAGAFLDGAAGGRPDCAVLDIHMAGMSGLELRVRMRADGWETAVIFVTAHDEPEMRREADAAGCSACFRKPVRGESLVAAITAAVVGTPEP